MREVSHALTGRGLISACALGMLVKTRLA